MVLFFRNSMVTLDAKESVVAPGSGRSAGRLSSNTAANDGNARVCGLAWRAHGLTSGSEGCYHGGESREFRFAIGRRARDPQEFHRTQNTRRQPVTRTPRSGLAVEMQDGFQLGFKQTRGRLGGLETEIIVAGDQQSPDTGK